MMGGAEATVDSRELAVLQALRLKGRASSEDVAAATGLPGDDADQTLARLAGAGAAREAGGRCMLTPPGRERLATLLGREREAVNVAAVASLYEQFTAVNLDFKGLASDWQMRDGEPNDHSDPAYDQSVLNRLAPVHEQVAPILDRAAEQAPRLSPYRVRLDLAYERVQSGDHAWLLKPLADSYHTVWFELHEELLQLAGLSREAEAAAGRAE
jgi:hypothetical protein